MTYDMTFLAFQVWQWHNQIIPFQTTRGDTFFFHLSATCWLKDLRKMAKAIFNLPPFYFLYMHASAPTDCNTAEKTCGVHRFAESTAALNKKSSALSTSTLQIEWRASQRLFICARAAGGEWCGGECFHAERQATNKGTELDWSKMPHVQTGAWCAVAPEMHEK